MHTQSSKLRKWSLFVTTLATAAFLLQGCGGGSDGAAGPAGPAGPTGPTGQPGKDLTAKVNVAAMTPEQWGNLSLKGEITGVTISSPPVVTFKVSDANGNPVTGLGFTTKASTAVMANLSNMSFTLAKLVPGAAGTVAGTAEPSKWVSYIVMSRPTVAAPTSIPRFPTSDSEGTLVDNGDGSYKYTFYRDITKIKEAVDAATYTGNNKKADLGDVSYQPTLVHRLGIQIGGNARGTSTNTADGVNSGLPAIRIKDPVNLTYDFIPATGKAVTATDTSREIVAIDKCNQCHTKLRLHGNRVETKFCVTCHTDQVKYGAAEAATTATGYSGSQMKINDFAVADFPNMVHKIHMGDELHMTGYNFANVLFNEVLYPQPRTNCVKCHSKSTATPQGDNWKTTPSRLACGACHDGINFATGRGVTLSGETHGHVGGSKADDKQCAICHDATNIPTYHVTNDPKPSAANSRAYYNGIAIPISSQLNMPAGVAKIDFEIKQVTVTGNAGAKKAKVVFRVMKDGAPATLNATGYLLNNIDGSPSIYVAYAVPQDGITTPVDWNWNINATLKAIRDTNTVGNSLSGPDSSGYYTASFGATIPDTATMVTGAMGINYGGFVQLNHASYPQGIMLREPQFAIKTADGYTARRSIVSNAKCNGCHGQLGVMPTFHGGARNNGEGCAMCHYPNKATGHTGSANSFGGGWSVAIKNLVHGIHGSSKRENAFTYEATAANPNGFKEVTYPAILNNCEQCHVAGSYDFSAAANAAALPNLLWTTDARTDMSNPTNAASIGLSPWVPAQTNYFTDNLVSSPVASSCFGCHDSKAAVAHMRGNGGTIVALASTVGNGVARPALTTATGSEIAPTNGAFKFNATETCMVCHGTGKVADIKSMHMTF